MNISQQLVMNAGHGERADEGWQRMGGMEMEEQLW